MCTKTKQRTLFQGSSVTNTPYFLRTYFNIIFQIVVHVLSIAVFCTNHLTPHTIYVCLNSLSPPFCCPTVLSQWIQNITVPCFVYRGSQSHSAAEQQWCCTVLAVWKPPPHTHTQNAIDSCMTPVTESQHLHSPYYQPAVLYNPSLTLTL